MLSDDVILRNLELLLSQIRTADAPQASELPQMAAAWKVLLPDLEDAELDAAVILRLRQARPWWPTPGQLLALVPRRRRQAIDDSETAWADVKAWLGAHRYAEPTDGAMDSDRRRDAAMRAGLRAAGGATGFGRSDPRVEGFAARRFASAYRAELERGEIQQDEEVSALVASSGASEALRRLEDSLAWPTAPKDGAGVARGKGTKRGRS